LHAAGSRWRGWCPSTRFGALKGKLKLPDAFFFDPLPEEEQRLWEGHGD
jgi:hypothetical protein